MKHDKIDSFPYGMSEEEANEVMKSEDVYDVLEVKPLNLQKMMQIKI